MRVAIVSYGLGNVQSVVLAVRRVGAEPIIVKTGQELIDTAPDRIILPGVGAVGAALERLRATGLADGLHQSVQVDGKPFLGICVGMQVLAERCEEFGSHVGLGWIPGTVSRLTTTPQTLQLPHVGWNNIAVSNAGSPVGNLDGLNLYFLHSYAMRCPDEYVTATADYGGRFVAAVTRGNVHGVQFHPEKSAEAGAALLQGFFGLPC